MYKLLLIISLLLTGCIKHDFTGKVTKQGNLISQQKVQRLKVGMSKQQVAAIMGSSLISPIFRDDRWDYAYSQQKANKPLHIRTLVLHFSHDRLVKLEKRLNEARSAS